MQAGRREFLIATAALGIGGAGGTAATLLAAPPRRLAIRKAESADGSPAAAKTQEEEPNTPPEVLMLDHAVEDRLLLIYADLADHLRAREDDATPAWVRTAAGIVRSFVEDYHQRLEEQHVFPLLESHVRLAPLVKTLKAQHDAGRLLTDKLLANPSPLSRRDLADVCTAYVRMARPHMAREATDLFQVLYDILSVEKVEELSDAFETKQEQLLGEGGFEKTLARIVAIETPFGLYDLEKFTPKG